MKKKSLIIGLAALLFPMGLSAQYSIYPVPHQQTAGTGTVAFTPTVTVVCDAGIDTYTKARVESVLKEKGLAVEFADAASDANSNIYIGVAGQDGKANAMVTQLGLSTDVLSQEGKYDRHVLSLSDAGSGRAQVVIVGENTDAAFCALASLEQIFDNGTEALQPVVINDYADLKSRGIIEGYYGLPYSMEARKDLFRFMMRYKMNTYVYGPKSDVFHSGYWKDPYPTTITQEQRDNGYLTQDDMKALCGVAHDCKVNLVWSIHPGNAILNSETVVDDIMTKFTSMYSLGFRQFAVFCDDVSVPSDDAGMQKTADRIGTIQTKIEEKWNKNYADPNDTVKPLRFTPQIYCRAFAGSDTQFNSFFNALQSLPQNVTVFYTGWGVWSVPNDGDLNTVQDQFGREVIWWWNYPCNDNGTGKNEIYPLDMKSNFYDMPNVNSNSSLPSEITASKQGILCNPMEQGEVSKTPVFSAGDFAWNNKAFNNTTSWEASFKAVFPGNETAQKAYRFLAPYLSKNDPESLNTLINSYKSNGNNTALNELMDNIVANCDVLAGLESSDVDGERLFYKDAKPWILRLRNMAQTTKNLLLTRVTADENEAWAMYQVNKNEAAALSTNDDYFTVHGSGFGDGTISTEKHLTHASYRYLTPFATEYLTQHAVDHLFPSTASTSAKLFSNVSTVKGTISSSSTATKINMSKAFVLPAGGYVGVELPKSIRVSSIDVADTLLANNDFRIMTSNDGKTWSSATDSVQPNSFMRYVVVLNVSDGDRSLRLRANTLAINHTQRAEVESVSVPEGDIWQNHVADYLVDGNYNTYVVVNKKQAVDDVYQIKLKEAQNIKSVRICTATTNDDYILKGVVQTSEDGNDWYTLKVAGTKSADYKMGLSQNFKVGTADGADVIATDFIPADGQGKPLTKKALYVRVKVTEAPDNKWVRLSEIEVNGASSNECKALQDANGIALNAGIDKDATTSTSSYALGTANGGEFVYYFLNYTPVKGVKLFCDDGTVDDVTYSITNDGETWNDVEAETANGLVNISLSDADKNAKALKIKWSSSTVPAICEVSELASDDTSKPVISGIEEVSGGETAADADVFSIENGTLVARSAIGLRSVEVYSLDGKLTVSQTLGGAKQAVMPVFGAAKAVLVKVTLTNGTTKTVKAVK